MRMIRDCGDFVRMQVQMVRTPSATSAGVLARAWDVPEKLLVPMLITT